MVSESPLMDASPSSTSNFPRETPPLPTPIGFRWWEGKSTLETARDWLRRVLPYRHLSEELPRKWFRLNIRNALYVLKFLAGKDIYGSMKGRAAGYIGQASGPWDKLPESFRAAVDASCQVSAPLIECNACDAPGGIFYEGDARRLWGYYQLPCKCGSMDKRIVNAGPEWDL